jgi:hypothetical protein
MIISRRAVSVEPGFNQMKSYDAKIVIFIGNFTKSRLSPAPGDTRSSMSNDRDA